MQTFLVSPSFVETAKILDDARLRKQQTEAEQILSVLLNPNPKGWANHPAVLQWKGYEQTLELYINAMARECGKRGFKSRHDGACEVFMTKSFPWWMVDEPISSQIYESHRARLLFKGRVDVAARALKSIGIKKVNQWLKEHKYPVTNQFKLQDIIDLEGYLTRQRATFTENHYKQFWPNMTTDGLPYVWPVTKNPIRSDT